MKGEVEIWRGDSLIHKESNMIVDGAGVIIADMMTATPSLSGYDPTLSSVLDPSNYCIQAISFGTGKDAFTSNAHNTGEPLGILIQQRQVYVWDNKQEEALLFVNFSAIDGSAYIPEAGFPEAPNPQLTRLEMGDTTTYQILPSEANVSSYFVGNGQLVNLLPSSIVLNTTEITGANEVDKKVIGSTLGCFPPGGVPSISAIAIFSDGSELSSLIGSSTFNSASSMDYSGFVSFQKGVSDPASGLVVAPIGFSYLSGVEYSVELGPGDLQCANLYGGIYHLGLWCLDLQQSLRSGNIPPYSFSILNNPRKYRLFAIKSFNVDITKNEDNGSTSGFTNYASDQNLLIKWKLKFL